MFSSTTLLLSCFYLVTLRIAFQLTWQLPSNTLKTLGHTAPKSKKSSTFTASCKKIYKNKIFQILNLFKKLEGIKKNNIYIMVWKW